MNCKQGDLAYITCAPYIGHFVNVLRWCNNGDVLPNNKVADGGDGWLCEKAHGVFNVLSSRKVPFTAKWAVISDNYLRPIRDNDGEDEMLRIAGLPNKQPEAA